MAEGNQVHVLHVVRTLIIEGGMERTMRRVMRGLSRRGIRHTVVLLSDEQEVLDLHDVAPVHRVYHPPKSPRMPMEIRALMRDLAPTAIHVRNWGPWLDTTLARLLSWPRAPLIWSFHGVESLHQLKLSKRAALRGAAMLTSRIFAVSQSAKRMLAEMIGIPSSRIEVIMNGVDAEVFAPGPSRARKGPLVVGTCGRLEPIKNQALLIEAAGDLLRFGHDVELRVAGTGSMLPRLRALAQAHGLGERAHFLGHVENVPAFLKELDVFALTSDSEGNPNALLEAMSTGLPVVATAVGGMVELVRPGDDGLLVPGGARAPLAEALARLAKDRPLRDRLGREARARVLGRYTLEHMLDAYEALYRDPTGDPLHTRVSHRAASEQLKKAG